MSGDRTGRDEGGRDRRWAARRWGLVGFVAAGLLVAQCVALQVATCETFDEFTYLVLGTTIMQGGDVEVLASPMCPPLPILLEYWLPGLRAPAVPKSPEWNRAVPGLIRQARLLTTLTVGVPLVLVVLGWAGRRRGLAAGALAGALVALSPSVVAHAGIATTDACFACFGVLALLALRRWQVAPTRGSYLLVGVALGAALGAKQSAAVLFGVAGIELALRRPARRAGDTPTDQALRAAWWVGSRLLAWVALAFLVDWGFYGFRLATFGHVGTTCTIPEAISTVVGLLPNSEAAMDFIRARLGMPLSIDTFVGQMRHARTGHGAYLLGEHRSTGWWYFFPVAIAVKSTPSELALFGLAAGLACRPATWRDPTRRLWLGAGLLLLGAGMASSLNIGQRYMLLLYPLVILLGSDGIGALAGRRPRAALIVGGLLAGGQAVSAAGIAPYDLSYFNALCGGPLAGHHYLVDSSLDWGQDLPALREALEARHYRKVALLSFTNAQADIYGLRSVGWMADDAAVADCDYLAISATQLRGGYGGGDLYALFRDLECDHPGYSIYLYDLRDPRVRAAWRAARHADRPAEDPSEPARMPVRGSRPERL